MTEMRDVVGAILFNDAGEVLLQQRDDRPDLRYPGYWTFFGGAVEAGEQPDVAILRELQEELELVDLAPRFWTSYVCPARTVEHVIQTTNHLYIARLNRPVSTLTLLEGQDMRYFARADALALELAFAQSPLLARFFDEYETLEKSL
jgi:8-oxo-dGTP diphosphatase